MNHDSSDYPAAHSMDTTWFAVDRDGNVAVFESGEAGAVPTEGYVGEEGWGLKDTARARLPSTEALLDVDGRARYASKLHLEANLALDLRYQDRLLLFLADLGPARELLTGATFTEAKAAKGTALRFTAGLTPAAFAALHERGLCAGCSLDFGDDEDGLAASGLFSYEHANDNVIAGPYVLLQQPERPAKLADLPPDVAAAAIAFDGSFAQTPVLNPAELWQCEAWGAAWLSSDGKTVRPFPGREDDYKDERDDGDESLVYLDQPLDLPKTRKAAPGAGQSAPADPASAAGAQPGKPWWKFW